MPILFEYLINAFSTAGTETGSVIMKGRQWSGQHTIEVRRKILNAAKDLFTSQGYKKTTIRQIVDKSGILTGSIYYLYKNKDEIFQSLILSLTKQCIRSIDEVCEGESEDYKCMAAIAIEMHAIHASPIVCECFYAGYTSPAIFEKFVEVYAELEYELFKDTATPYSREETFHQALTVRSAMGGCVMAHYFNEPFDYEKYLDPVLSLVLYLHGVPRDEMSGIIAHLHERDELWKYIGKHLRDAPVEEPEE